MKTRFSFLAICLLLCNLAFGAPALRTPIQYVQPDGTEITIYLIGDEYYSYRTTTDGYLLAEGDNKFLYYASLDDDNQIVPSAFRASQQEDRTEEAKTFLSTIDLEKQTEVFEKSYSDLRKASKQRMTPDYMSQARIAADEATTRSVSTGQKKVLVVLVEYQDVRFSVSSPQNAFHKMLNEPGYSDNGGTGSARDYFMECSYGKYQPDFDVYGPILLANNRSYYGYDNKRSCEMASEACDYLYSQGVDFTQYDNTNDGYIDNIFVFFAGHGEAEGGPQESVWPFAWYVRAGAGIYRSYDGKILDRFACSNELRGSWGTNMVGIGTFCHEFSHVLGLADYYDTSGSSGAFTPGDWDIMAGGNYNNSGRTPPYWCSFSRTQVGWLKPTNLNPADTTVILNNLADGVAYKIPTTKSNEYFLLENRQRKGFDQYLPASGMLIWHIDYDANVWWSNSPNNNADHQRVDIEEADNIKSYSTLAGDVFPGTSNVKWFTDDTQPGMLSWDNSRQERVVREINHKSGIISFLYEATFEAPSAPLIEKATKVTSTTFDLNWQSVEDADSYEIDVYRKVIGVVYATGYQAKNVGNVTSATVTGLRADKEYFFVVRAVKSYKASENSTELSVNTRPVGFTGLSPEVSEPSFISENSFAVSWLPVEEAESYNVTVYKEYSGEEMTSSYDFTTKMDPLPEGWECNVTSTVNSAVNAGIAPPSMRANVNGAYISSPVNEWPIKEFGFWYKSTNEIEENKLIISMHNGRYWETIEEIKVTDCSDGVIYTSQALQDLYYGVKIEFVRPMIGTVYIDDITVKHCQQISEPVEGYDNLNVGDITTFHFDKGEPDTRYRFVVTAQKGEETSWESDELIIYTLADNNIPNALHSTEEGNIYFIPASGTIVNNTGAYQNYMLFDTYGSLLKSGILNEGNNFIQISKGIYFLRVNDTVVKIIR